jgi:aryl-alcohol dehydrogenase-like predicted oxidoreductase
MTLHQSGAVAESGTFAIGGDMCVHRMGFGAMRLLGPNIWGEPADPPAAIALLRRAVELGVDFIDTAEAYGPEINERQIAEAFFPYPPALVVASKCGLVRTWPAGAKYPKAVPDGRPEAIRTSIEGSLRRLRRETIDLYQLHRIDPNVPIEESVGALDALRHEGKLRHIGLSEVTVEQLAAARAVAPIATVQNRYSLLHREHEAVLAACEAAGIGFIPWHPLAGGPKAMADNPVVTTVAERYAAAPAQVALAWLLARSPAMLLIPGTASIRHLEENIAAAALTLGAEDIAALDEVTEE